MIIADEDLGVQVGDCSTLVRYTNDRHFRAILDAETQRNRDAANAIIDASIQRARERKSINGGI